MKDKYILELQLINRIFLENTIIFSETLSYSETQVKSLIDLIEAIFETKQGLTSVEICEILQLALEPEEIAIKSECFINEVINLYKSEKITPYIESLISSSNIIFENEINFTYDLEQAIAHQQRKNLKIMLNDYEISGFTNSELDKAIKINQRKKLKYLLQNSEKNKNLLIRLLKGIKIKKYIYMFLILFLVISGLSLYLNKKTNSLPLPKDNKANPNISNPNPIESKASYSIKQVSIYNDGDYYTTDTLENFFVFQSNHNDSIPTIKFSKNKIYFNSSDTSRITGVFNFNIDENSYEYFTNSEVEYQHQPALSGLYCKYKKGFFQCSITPTENTYVLKIVQNKSKLKLLQFYTQ